MSGRSGQSDGGGLIGWMVRNRVTPNILMLTLLIGGLMTAMRIKQEVFPEFDADYVTVTVPYPGASPAEVEQGIILVVEEAVRGLEGVKEVRSRASEGVGTVVAELREGADRQKTYQDIKQAVDRVITFPEDADEPRVSLSHRRHDVLDIELYGHVSEHALREAAEHVRDRLLQSPQITQVDLDDARAPEVHIEIPQENLRRYGLTLDQVAARVRRSAVEIPGGKIETRGGELLFRVAERRDWAREFADLVIVARPDGTLVRLGDLGQVYDGFRDTDHETYYNGMPSIGIDVYRVGQETPISVSEAAKAILPRIESELPPGIHMVLRIDDSKIYRQRMQLLLKNAMYGLVLVLALLGLFLEFKLAFWVMMGIPISFLGGLMLLPAMDVSINMISLFAFIVALGIVVDDAIVAGENIYEYRQRGMGLVEAAIRGARDIAVPVIFAVLTNIVAFLPLYFVPGFLGKIWKVIPLVVITVFSISLVEALLILPSHLAHTTSEGRTGLTRFLHARQQAFSRLVRHLIERVYGPFLTLCLRWRTVVAATGFAGLMLVVAYVLSGRIPMIHMPRVESDRSVVTAVLPYGCPVSKARQVCEHLLAAGRAVVRKNGGQRLSDGNFAEINENEVEVTFYLTDPGVRPISTTEFTRLWRQEAGEIAGLHAIRYQADRGGPGSGAALTVELSHRNIRTLDKAGAALAARLAEFAAVTDVDDGYSPGKPQLDFRIKPEGLSLGLTARDLAAQVRSAFQGNRAIRQQRGRNEITVRVRRPESERVNEYDVEQMILHTPDGGQVPLMEVAEVRRGRAYTSIRRRNGRRTVTVTADVDPLSETSRIQAALNEQVMPQLVRDFPGLTWRYEGRQADMQESQQALYRGMLVALLGIYVLLAIPFASYVQPMLVMLAIPFGIVGAVAGHLLMGYSLSIISIMGIVALAGVVVNDALVLIEQTNRLVRQEGLEPMQAVHQAAVRRFRPILLTTLTTFGGLAPMIFETSRQARFMIPMAISLGYGILFATVITLVILPCLYLLSEDCRRLVRWLAAEQAVQPAGSS